MTPRHRAVLPAPSNAPLLAPRRARPRLLHRSLLAAGLLAGASIGSAIAQSDDEQAARAEAATACEDAAQLLRDDDLDGAVAEARWCLESLEQIERERTVAIFPDAVEGWEGGTLDQQGAMGMNMLSRSYSREADSIDVTLTSGAAGSGLAAIAQMGMAMGGGGKKFRIQKRTVLDMADAGDEGGANYLVELRSGGMLTVESSDVEAEAVLEFLRAFPIAEIDDALKE